MLEVVPPQCTFTYVTHDKFTYVHCFQETICTAEQANVQSGCGENLSLFPISQFIIDAEKPWKDLPYPFIILKLHQK